MTSQEIEKYMIDAMRNNGWRITEQRKYLVQLFAYKNEYFSPIDVYEKMSKKFSGISYDTVYRNLRQLHELGVLEQFHFSDGVKFKSCHVAVHHHHAICIDCKKTFSIDFCPMEISPNLPSSFKVVSHNFEIYGYCKDCPSQNS